MGIESLIGPALGAIMGGFGSQGRDSQTTQQQLPPEFQQLGATVGQYGQGLAGLQYQPYPYETVAPFNPYQYTGMDMIANRAQNPYGLPQQAESALGQQIGGQLNPYANAQTPVGYNQYQGAQTNVGFNPYSDAQTNVGFNPMTGAQTQVGTNQYAGQNPYLENAISGTLGDMSKQFNLNVAPSIAAQTIKGGSFGNTGQQEGENALRTQLAQEQMNTAGNMRMQDYGMQQGLAESDINRRMGAQQTDLARNASLYGQDIQNRMGAQQQDLSRNANLYGQDITNRMTAQQADLLRNSGMSEADIQRRMGAAQTDLSRNSGAYESMFGRQANAINAAPSIYNLGYQPGQQMMGIGGTMQQQGQNYLTSQQQQFNQAQQWPFQIWDAIRSPFGGINAGGTTTTTGPQGNVAAGMLGGAMLGNQIAPAFGQMFGSQQYPVTDTSGYSGLYGQNNMYGP